jgi:hypothetical protein
LVLLGGRGPLGAVLALGLTSCATMRSDVTIKASPERVWGILTDVQRYPEWNPFFVRATGQLRPDESLDVTMQPVGKDAQSFSPKVLDVRPGRRLTWRGRLVMPGLFDGTHYFMLEPLCDGRVRFVQLEHFSGLLVPFASFDPYRQGWLKMNQALKERAERVPPAR